MLVCTVCTGEKTVQIGVAPLIFHCYVGRVITPNEDRTTLQGINISHIGKRKIIFKMPFLGDMLVPWRVPQEKDHLL